tara:strand:- start:9745 stop:9849 length:105 start_codon:yes stop_codon:yes gene_type:complete
MRTGLFGWIMKQHLFLQKMPNHGTSAKNVSKKET